MHILHVETGQHLYGGALQVLYLVKGLKKEECRSTLVCTKGSKIGEAAAGFVPIHEVPMVGELDPRFVLRLRRIICTEHPDIVHVHSRRGADFWGIIAARLSRTKVVLTRRVDNPEPRWVAQMKYRLCDGMITISEGIRQVLLSEGIPAHKIVCVPSGVAGEQYDQACQSEWFCSEFDLRPDNKVIGVIGQLIPRKGHRYLIEAAPEILKHYPETRFLFFGQGPLQHDLQQSCKSMDMATKVHFAGFRMDLERILPCLDLVVHPATMEGLGVSLLQAAAAGVPIVATRVGGIPEIVHDGVNGYLVDVGNTQAIVDAVLTLLHTPLKAKRLGRAGRELMRSHFSLEAMVAGNLRVYHDMLSEKAH
jgi:glycosyltransferase involved in cell wall biosynthesis